jgi:hypothetical protein
MDDPVPTNVVPHPPVYQFHTAPVPKEPPFTDNVVELPGHTWFTVAEILVGAVEFVLTFIVSDAQAVVLHVPCAST